MQGLKSNEKPSGPEDPGKGEARQTAAIRMQTFICETGQHKADYLGAHEDISCLFLLLGSDDRPRSHLRWETFPDVSVIRNT